MAGVIVRQELEMVARLQNIDTQLKDIETEKGDLPALVKRLQNSLSGMGTNKTELEERQAEIAAQRRNNDGQAKLLRVKLDKYKEDLYKVTTNKEYDAINSEIESTRGQVEAMEKIQSDLLEEEERLGIEILSIEEKVVDGNSELVERETELGNKNEETESEETLLIHEREKLVVRIKKPIVSHYDRIRVVRNGTGAAHLYAGACGACYAVVPPQRQAEIRKMKDIILCETCGVILLPEEELMGLDEE
jgi:uncharacterized protein